MPVDLRNSRIPSWVRSCGRARQLFAEIVRELGMTLTDPEFQHVKEVQRVALYVAGALASKLEEWAFELKMKLSPRCTVEVDIWRALKREWFKSSAGAR
jgi:hypothetical protein